MLLAETSQQVVQVAGALQEKHEALVITQNKMVEMQSQMDAMMNQIKDQNNMIQALQVQKTDPAKFQAFQVEANAKNEALQFAKTAEANAHSQAMLYACVNALENQFQSRVQAIEAEASDRIRQSLDDATMRVTQSQEESSRVVQNAQQEVVSSQGQIEH